MFVAIYRWRLHAGKDEQFREAWRRGTAAITSLYGSFGSRLHRVEPGLYIAYAEWPDEASWRKAADARMVYDDAEARAMFLDAVAEAQLLHAMPVTDDMLTLRAPLPDHQ